MSAAEGNEQNLIRGIERRFSPAAEAVSDKITNVLPETVRGFEVKARCERWWENANEKGEVTADRKSTRTR